MEEHLIGPPSKDRLTEVGGRLLAFRLAKDLSQKAVAEGIGLSDAWLSEVEQGKIDVPLSRLLALAGELGLEVVVAPKDDPVDAVERAVEGDPDLSDQARAMVLATYRAAREPARPLARRASSRSRVHREQRTTRVG